MRKLAEISWLLLSFYQLLNISHYLNVEWCWSGTHCRSPPEHFQKPHFALLIYFISNRKNQFDYFIYLFISLLIVKQFRIKQISTCTNQQCLSTIIGNLFYIYRLISKVDQIQLLKFSFYNFPLNCKKSQSRFWPRL